MVLEQVGRRVEFEAALREHGVAIPSRTSISQSEPCDTEDTPPMDAASIESVASPGIAPTNNLPLLVLPAVPECELAAGDLPWFDLAQNRPGERVKEVAAYERYAAPFKSRLARVVGSHNRERSFRVGGKGEEKVGRELARLPNAWRALHSVPVGTRGSDIDHVVIGPGGVFTVNAKNHPDARVWVKGDTVLVNGQRVHYVRNSRFEAKRASSKLTELCGLPISVVGIVSLVGCNRGLEVKAQPSDGSVFVVARRNIVQWLTRHGEILDADQVERIFGIARRSTTWTR